MKELMCSYVTQKLAFNKLNKDGQAFTDLQSYVTLYDNLEGPEVSNIIYLNVFNQKADNKQTLLAIVNSLYEEFIVKEGQKWVMVEGDAKTYDINYQEVLYFDAGLKELAKASGYNPNLVSTNFKHTHHFLLEIWEGGNMSPPVETVLRKICWHFKCTYSWLRGFVISTFILAGAVSP